MTDARPVAALVLALIGGPVMAQAPADALSGMARQTYLEARMLEGEGRWRDAAVRYRMVLKAEPSFRTAWLDLGQALEEAGDPDGAEAAYGQLPFDADAVESLGRLYLSQNRAADALPLFVRMRDLRPESPHPLLLEAAAWVASDPHEAHATLLEYLGRPGADVVERGGLPVVQQVASALARDGALEQAMALVEQVLTQAGPSPGSEATVLVGLRDQLVLEQEARELAGSANEPLSEPQRRRLAAARAAKEDGRAALEALLEEAPRNAEVWSTWGTLREQMGDLVGAEQAYRVAERLAPLDARHPAKVARLLQSAYAGRFPAEAADAYARATRRGDPDPELWLERARAEVGAGRFAAAEASASRFLQLRPDGPGTSEARSLVAGLQVTREPVEITVPSRGPPGGLTDEQWLQYNVALRLEQRRQPGDHERAMTGLEALVRAAPAFTPGHNLLAAMLYQSGQHQEAIARYERSLEHQPDQPKVLVLLADLHAEAGREAEGSKMLQKAADSGSPDAQLRLARKDLDAWRLVRAADRLDAVRKSAVAVASPREARRLEDDLARRWRGVSALAGFSLLMVVGLPVAVQRRRRGGATVRDLLGEAHVAWPEVARIGSAVRHEVLKHNTTGLGAVAQGLQSGDARLADWACARLYGGDGALARFWTYLADLEALGRAHGLRLNLRHKDPVFAPLYRAMSTLQALEPELRRGEASIAGTLRELDSALNITGYRNLGELLSELCLLAPSEDLFARTWARVKAERPEAGALTMDLPQSQWLIRIYQRDFEDILTNLMRNAVEAGSKDIGIQIAFESDDITGLERVAVAVCDQAPGRVTTGMIRGRYIERGLGLAVDLISRNGGSIHVDTAPEPWTKSIVVRLPRAEAPPLEDNAS